MNYERQTNLPAGTLFSRAVKQASPINSNYRALNVEGTSLIYVAAASYSTQQQDWFDYILEVQWVAFADDWIGISFRYQDANNYYRLELNAQEHIRRLKKVSNGTTSILWLQPGGRSGLGYHPGTVYTTRIQLEGPKIAVSLKEGFQMSDRTLDWRTLVTVVDSSYVPYIPYNSYNAGSRSTVTFALWSAGNDRAYFLNVKMYRDHHISKHSNVAARGGGDISMRGEAFGNHDTSVHTRIRSTVCQISSWISTTSVRCAAAPGYSRSHKITLTIGEQLGSVTDALSFGIPFLSSACLRDNRAGTGSATITVHGANFATVGSTQAMRWRQTASEATTWLSVEALPCRGCNARSWGSDTQILGMVPAGVRGSRRVTVTAGQSAGTSTVMYSIDLVAISHSRRMNRAITGSASVTVHGASLGLVAYTAMGREGHTGCEGTEWESETSVRCLSSRAVVAFGSSRLLVSALARAGFPLSFVVCFDGKTLAAQMMIFQTTVRLMMIFHTTVRLIAGTLTQVFSADLIQFSDSRFNSPVLVGGIFQLQEFSSSLRVGNSPDSVRFLSCAAWLKDLAFLLMSWF